MKKSRKVILRAIPVALCLVPMLTSTSSIFAISVKEPTGGTVNASVETFVNNIWSTVAFIIQIVALAAIIIAGLRYMFASADDKANIKKQTIVLVVGAALVFAAVPIATLISNIANSLFGGSGSSGGGTGGGTISPESPDYGGTGGFIINYLFFK